MVVRPGNLVLEIVVTGFDTRRGPFHAVVQPHLRILELIEEPLGLELKLFKGRNLVPFFVTQRSAGAAGNNKGRWAIAEDSEPSFSHRPVAGGGISLGEFAVARVGDRAWLSDQIRF